MTRAGRRASVALATLAGCVPVAIGVLVMASQVSSGSELDHARRDAARAAVQATQDLLSYDYRTIDKDIAKAKSDATGLFRRQYAQSAGRLAAQARQTRAIVQASPGHPGVVSASSGEVVVLVFVDQASVKQVQGADKPTTRIDQSRVRLTMRHVGDRWLVSQLSAL